VSDKNDYTMRGRVASKSQLIAIGGGKGGVGKTFISSSLAIFLSYMGFKTIILDLDLGASNLHTSLGIPPTQFTTQSLVLDPTILINEVAASTPFPNLTAISGATDALEIANITHRQKSQLLSRIFNAEADFIVMDLSAGTHTNTIDFFLTAQERALVITPDPTSIENAYRFMRTAFFRNVNRYESQFNLKEDIDEILKHKVELGINNPSDLLRVVQSRKPQEGRELQRLLRRYDHKIILNQTHSYKERELGHSIQSVCNRYFGIPTEYLGYVDYDYAVMQALKQRKHLLTEYPHSRLYTQLLTLAKSLIKQKNSCRISA